MKATAIGTARRTSVAAGVALAAFSASADASINLELRPGLQSVLLGSNVSIDLYAVSDSAFNQGLAALQSIITWDMTYVQLLGDSMTGSPMLAGSPRFGPDSYGLNSSLTDGSAIWVGFGPFGSPVQATPAGTFITRFNFSTLATTSGTPVGIAATGGINNGHTAVFDGSVPGLEVTGALTGATVQINPVPAPGGLALLVGGLVCHRRRRRA